MLRFQNRCTLFLLAACCAIVSACQLASTDRPASSSATGPVRSLTVLYTNDEHGWMEGSTPGQGAANLYGLWQQQEGYDPDGPFLILSGGDNWTGPAVSTQVQGASMVQVMNAMHYDASAIGNHEFDFGLDVLRQRIEEANFPYLSANTRWRAGNAPTTDLGIQPYSIFEVNDLRVGIIGLTTTTTPRTTNPVNVSELQFLDYEETLRSVVPRVRAAEVNLLFVIAHVCLAPLRELAQRVTDLEIQLIGAGHCNESTAEKVNRSVILGGGSRFTTYARATFHYDIFQNRLLDVEYSTNENLSGNPNFEIAEVVRSWQQNSEALMSVVIGFNEQGIDRRTGQLEERVVDSWLLADPTADIAISNAGGVRASLPAGDITIGTMVGIMPFDNTIVAVYLSGSELRQILSQGRLPIVAGLIASGDDWLSSRTTAPLVDEQRYRVLVNSFMYAGGDNYQAIAEFDPEGFDTGTHYRQPFIDWISSLQTSPQRPLRLAAIPR